MEKSKREKDGWLKIDISAPYELTDAIANFMEENGAEGVYQESLYSPSLDYPEAEKEPVYECLTAHVPKGRGSEVIASLKDYFADLKRLFPDLPEAAFTKREIRAPDWEEEWKKYFHPLRIGNGFIIKPTWEAYNPTGNDIVIEIDPGMAFGTGQHYSTSMCLEAMEDIFSNKDASRWRILDLGTGTGILGIAAARLGAGSAVGLDIDKNAVEIARGNVLLNKVGDRMKVSRSPVSSLKKPFDLIVANLTAKPLMELKDKLESLLKPGGCLIISGIIESNREAIEACFLRPALRLARKMQKEEWLCYVFTKE